MISFDFEGAFVTREWRGDSYVWISFTRIGMESKVIPTETNSNF